MTDSEKKDEAQARLRNLCELYGLTVGGVYEHYKGGLYVIVALSIHEATYDALVTYRSNAKGTCSTRTLENFTQTFPRSGDQPGGRQRFMRARQ